MRDAAIVRHRGKIEAAIANARATLEVQDRYGSLAAMVWDFEPPRRGRQVPGRLGDLPAVTAESKALAKALRRHGFRFVGPTTAYAAMESLGLINDHLWGCHVRVACNKDRQATDVPRSATGIDRHAPGRAGPSWGEGRRCVQLRCAADWRSQGPRQ